MLIPNNLSIISWVILYRFYYVSKNILPQYFFYRYYQPYVSFLGFAYACIKNWGGKMIDSKFIDKEIVKIYKGSTMTYVISTGNAEGVPLLGESKKTVYSISTMTNEDYMRLNSKASTSRRRFEYWYRWGNSFDLFKNKSESYIYNGLGKT